MKVVAPSPLLAEAAEVIGPIRDEVVVVGAAALEVALTEAEGAIITPTRDVDMVVPVDRAGDVVSHLEAADLRPSEVPHERGYTWVRGDLKVQLVRTFHPFPRGAARGLPANPVFGVAAAQVHQLLVAFADNPTDPRLRCANSGCLLALKQAAFGRTRPTDETPVDRDYHDAYLLVSAVPEDVATDLHVAEHEVRQRAADAIAQLAAGGDATIAAARQLVRLQTADSQRAGEAGVRRAAIQMQRRLDTTA